MSLNDKKNSLFGKGSNPTPTENKPERKINVPSSTTSSTTQPTMGISNAQKASKQQEANELINTALKHLETTMFKWTPDYLAAAPCYEKASSIYKGLGDLDQAREMLIRSADCHDKSGCASAAALSYSKAAQIAQSQNQGKLASELYLQASQLYGINGDLDRCAEFQYKAAVELQNIDKNKCIQLYKKAIDRYYPSNISNEEIKSINVKVIDVLRSFYSYLIKQQLYKEAIIFAKDKLITYYDINEYDASLFKLLASIIILYLALGEVDKADKVFVEEHFGYKGFLTSKECELAENFLLSFKMGDQDKLNTTKASQELTYLEPDIQVIGKGLSLGDEMDLYAKTSGSKAYNMTSSSSQPINTSTSSNKNKTPSTTITTTTTAACDVGGTSTIKTSDDNNKRNALFGGKTSSATTSNTTNTTTNTKSALGMSNSIQSHHLDNTYEDDDDDDDKNGVDSSLKAYYESLLVHTSASTTNTTKASGTMNDSGNIVGENNDNKEEDDDEFNADDLIHELNDIQIEDKDDDEVDINSNQNINEQTTTTTTTNNNNNNNTSSSTCGDDDDDLDALLSANNNTNTTTTAPTTTTTTKTNTITASTVNKSNNIKDGKEEDEDDDIDIS